VSVIYGTTPASAADSKISNQPDTFESNGIEIVRFEFESNQEASQVSSTFGVFCHAVDWTCQDIYVHHIQIYSYTRSKLMKGGQKFTNLALRAHHTPYGKYFVIHEVGHAKIYQSTKI